MFSPPNYTVRKYPLNVLLEKDYDLSSMTVWEDKVYYVKQGDNMLFRQIRLITGDTSEFNKHICFVDCASGKTKPDVMKEIVCNGFYLPEGHFVVSERSASMTRTGILSFVRQEIAEELNQRIKLDMPMTKTVLSKYYAYRGLMLSSCHMFEGWRPKIIIVPDMDTVIPQQRIKYAEDVVTHFVDKEGRERDWKQKEILEGVRDITINAFDGCGIHHPSIGREIEKMLKKKRDEIAVVQGRTPSDKPLDPVTTFILRGPYLKGLSLEMDYESFFKERGVTKIKDIWGMEHDVTEPMMIMTESMYKGKKYFQRDGTYHDWELYWEAFDRYDHVLGITKWNFSAQEEPLMTRGNYQILQDLDLEYDEFKHLADDTAHWVERIVSGDPLYTYCFLGLMADNAEPLNNYGKAIMKNPEMLKEKGVRSYLVSLLDKYRDDMKCGKLYLPGTFKFLAPDLIALMEHIGGLEVKGVLAADEFFCFDRRGQFLGERLIERNPHICKSEHTILTGVVNDELTKWCGHLVNVCMINIKSITPQRLNGADFDGDLCFVLNCPAMMKGVDRNAAVTIDVEDKITVAAEEDTFENRLKIILRTLSSKIGEISNYATAYHNKRPQTVQQKKKYEGYVDLLSIANGKEIDKAKTGVNYNVPRHIAKYGRPLPYFMQYASPYYQTLKTFNKAPSNMNRLCWDLERWDKEVKFKRVKQDFDWMVMIDDDVEVNVEKQEKVEELYLQFCKEMMKLSKVGAYVRQVGNNKKKQEEQYDSRGRKVVMLGDTVNWNFYYEEYKQKAISICPDVKELANIVVRLCYEKYPQKNRRFLWIVAGDGIVENIKQVPIYLPQRRRHATAEEYEEAERNDMLYKGEIYDMVLCHADDVEQEDKG